METQSLLSPVKLWWQTLTDTWTGKAPAGAKRSSKWAKVRETHLKANPTCACCGGKEKLEVHHIQPFHLRPELELEPSNLITLCESGKHGLNCHLLMGHLGNWKTWNPFARIDAAAWRAKLSGWLDEQIKSALGQSAE